MEKYEPQILDENDYKGIEETIKKCKKAGKTVTEILAAIGLFIATGTKIANEIKKES